MIACGDADYREDYAVAGCVLFQEWTDSKSTAEYVEIVYDIEPYQPGQFYLRELPCLLKVLGKVVEPISIIIVDGYVWLDSSKKPGLGAKLYEALNDAIPIIGVAKSSFADSTGIAVIRGTSTRPLFVTSVGIEPQIAAEYIQQMHGANRIPTLLKRVDTLCRKTAIM
jgi:deoxyribonuclease V